MKANAPEKIYVDVNDNLSDSILYAFTKKDSEHDIEYTRTDVFIEKAEEYLYRQLNKGNLECGDIEAFIKLFKNYMKG